VFCVLLCLDLIYYETYRNDNTKSVEGEPAVTPTVKNARCHIIAKGGADAIEFYKKAFGAIEEFRMTDPGDRRIGHAQLLFGETTIMLADEYPDFGALSPDTIGGSPVTFHLATDGVDALVAQAVSCGAIVLRAPANQSFGERQAQVLDPFGYRWTLSQPTEDVSPEEMQRRWEEETSA
jgi:PhnB protein